MLNFWYTFTSLKNAERFQRTTNDLGSRAFTPFQHTVNKLWIVIVLG